MVDVELYGGRRGFLEHVRGCALYALGTYRSARNVEWNVVRRLAFVCRGNICRSPYASAKARSLGAPAVSFGLDAMVGASADPAASKNALSRGVDLTAHRCARLTSSSIVDGDLIIAFEPAHLVEISKRCGDRAGTSLLGIWVRPIRPHVQDPYGRSDRYFQQCFSVIDANVAELVKRMTNRSNLQGTGISMRQSATGGTRMSSCDRTRA